MNREKIAPIVKGLIKHLPGARFILPMRTGGTTESRYCYSVWMRHLNFWHCYKNKTPDAVAELGPGDSLGTGLAALLSGSKHLYTLDIMRYGNSAMNLKIFEELVILYKNKTPVPDNIEYPRVSPRLSDYSFPSDIITDNTLKEALSERRLDIIREEILNPQLSGRFIKYAIPWYDENIILKNSVDFIFSQAVLQHVEDLENTYKAMSKWLKPSGLMSHTIDLKSMGTTKTWNGHWTFSDFEWNIVKGGRIYLINRQPYSKHLEFHEKYAFKILNKIVVKKENTLKQQLLSTKFRELTEEDITTCGAYIISQKE